MTGQDIFLHIKKYKSFYSISAIEKHCNISNGALQKAVQRPEQKDFKESDKLVQIFDKLLIKDND